MKKHRFIISGGGTGGHIFPAVSIANEIKRREPEAEILFVGAEGRMEMERVPAAGYAIVGLPIKGLERKKIWRNIPVIAKLLKSLRIAAATIEEFRPDAVIGVGGYASAPVLWMAQRKGIPTLIQEQNSYAGVANKILGRKAGTICVAYEGMEKFFPKEKIVLTGNPIRSDLFKALPNKDEALAHFGLSTKKKTILLIGGSLGARTLNEAVKRAIDRFTSGDVQLIWQCGKYYHPEMETFVAAHSTPNVKLHPFISEMGMAFSAADVVISRAGASSVSEFCAIGKPVVLVPSPNVSEDHQTKNALALVEKEAAVMVKESVVFEELFPTVFHILEDEAMQRRLSERIKALAIANSAGMIVDHIYKLLPTHKQ